jgi:hypothetical protein
VSTFGLIKRQGFDGPDGLFHCGVRSPGCAAAVPYVGQPSEPWCRVAGRFFSPVRRHFCSQGRVFAFESAAFCIATVCTVPGYRYWARFCDV